MLGQEWALCSSGENELGGDKVMEPIRRSEGKLSALARRCRVKGRELGREFARPPSAFKVNTFARLTTQSVVFVVSSSFIRKPLSREPGETCER